MSAIFRVCTRTRALRTEDLNKEMNRLQVGQFVVICVNTYAEEEASIATVYNLVIPELQDEMVSLGLKGNRDVQPPQRSLTGISGRVQLLPDEPPHVDEAVIRYIHTAICPAIDTGVRTFSSSSYGTYHFDKRVFP
jgi:hypothetical protein